MSKTEVEIYRKHAEALEEASEEVFKRAQQAGNEEAANHAYRATQLADTAKAKLDDIIDIEGEDPIEAAKQLIAEGKNWLFTAETLLENGK